MGWKTRLGIWRSELKHYLRPFYRYRLRRFYGGFVQPGDLCFDIGAHLGSRTQAFLDLGAQVVSVEPHPQCADFLRRKFHGRPGWHLDARAVGAQAGWSTLHINTDNPTISTLSSLQWRQSMAAAANRVERWDRSIDVPVVSLEELIQAYGLPAFCKMDIEGSEAEALAGLEQPLPCLSFEFISLHPTELTRCLDRLDELGHYLYNWSEGESLRLRSRKWLRSDEIRERLATFSKSVVSGDIYARRVETTAH